VAARPARKQCVKRPSLRRTPFFADKSKIQDRANRPRNLRREILASGVQAGSDPEPDYAACLLRIVEDDSDGMPHTRPHAADPVPKIDPVNTLRALDRAIVDSKSDSVALPKRHDLDPALHPRALLR
jgi:hypothetical protein